MRCALYVGAAACLLGLMPKVWAQRDVPPPPLTQKDPKCKPGSKSAACKDAAASDNAVPAKPAADPFAFPVEDSKHGADAEGALPSAPGSASGNASGSKEAPAAPANPNGLPEMPTARVPDPPASSEASRRMPASGIMPDDGSSSSSSSSAGDDASATEGSSSSRSNADDDVAPTTAAPNAPVKASPLRDMGSSGSTSEARQKLEKTRVADDLKVGKFYLQDGNTQGAYLRYKDAVDHDPDDPEAHFGLAESAAKLKKTEEAVLHYQETLRLDPDGDHDRASRRALQALGVVAKK